MTNVCFAEAIKLGHGSIRQSWWSCPYDGNRFGFQRMDDKVKDGLVLSVVWCWGDTKSRLGLCFSFGRTIKGDMDG